MLRLARRAALLFGLYVGFLLAVVAAGFLAQAVGVWASILWGAALIAGVVRYVRRRRDPSATIEP